MVLKDYLINNNNFMLNKEEVLKNLDKVKEWISECDSKKETVNKNMTKKLPCKHHWIFIESKRISYNHCIILYCNKCAKTKVIPITEQLIHP